ncbi:surfeit locus protein 1-like [Ornithodoros turicata]|uniref:surfeit locus protein 1-like n=1 Tax=Ornithodoros turicata TaxID=34597 RepID=UPI0031387466
MNMLGRRLCRTVLSAGRNHVVPTARRSNQVYRGSIKIEPKIGVAGYSLLAIPVVAFGLGTWQVQRRKWKLGLIEELARKTELPPCELPDNWSDLGKMEYQQVRVTGTFDHSNEMYVSPRSRIQQESERYGGGGLISTANSGALVVTPFKLSGREETILVNRGWVPRNKIPPNTRQEGQVEGEVELVGIVRRPEKRPPLGPKDSRSGHTWHYKDTESMARYCNAWPILIDAIAASSVPGGPIGGQTNVTLRNEHFSYILTWYSLSAITACLWYMKYFRRMPLM